ncbi:hypothetical protein NECAME_09034 [Necator americanus]|uniref:Uncharacterized protein n=1 Tax=Necator americanus TaxID=51031 RepID=W2TGE9_NECAM|nr:hypothetical protein NECAME_09034 [Necator americanus]ETN80674.1 hypothetical protein NECAME_09034 [Necator americanus]
MKVEHVIESPRETGAVGAVDWQPKLVHVVVPRLALLANTVLFELKKASIKWKQYAAQSAKRRHHHDSVVCPGRSVLSMAQACHFLRGLILKNINSLERRKSNLYDLHVDFNMQSRREDVRALKRHRWVRDAAYSADSISDVIPPLLLCQLRINFGNNVAVSHWITEIHTLYKEKRLLPISLNFGGGCFTKGYEIKGVGNFNDTS